MSDPRFAALQKDPRYRLPSKKESRTAVDPRFKSLFSDKGFRQKATVDRYGRKIKAGEGRKDLERLYKLEKEDDSATKKGKKVESEVVGTDEQSVEDEDEDETGVKRDPARDGGFSASESEEETSEDDEEDESDAELEIADDTAGQEQAEDIPDGEVSRRIAAVNLDWDNLRAVDIMAVAFSFAPSGGRIESVVVYPSEFGRERLEREELEGPPKEIFGSSSKAQDDEGEDEDENEEDEEEEDDDSDDADEDEKIKQRLLREQADDGSEFNTAALRQYQLERLRYYYAVIECDSKATAKHLYDSMDGREYLTTANFFDLRFIPEATDFDDDRPRDECTKLPSGYQPNDFKTEALTHSKVRLTWDDDDATRKEMQKRAFSRAEIEENDLQAYIGSDESDVDSTTSRKAVAEDRKAKKKEEQRRLMREKLGLTSETAASKKAKDEPVGDMQITFTSGLGKGKEKGGVFENEPQDEESTRARYIRKEKERKQKRKERSKQSRGGEDAAASDKEDKDGGVAVGAEEGEEDVGFDDPFFNDPAAAAQAEKKARKAEKQKKRDALAAKEAADAEKRKELELVMMDDKNDAVRHFDMRNIEKAEKKKGKKGKKGKKAAASEEAEAGADAESFKVDGDDPRFKALFESHEYAIDPSNPKYKNTEGMKALLEEGRKRKRTATAADDGEEGASVKQKSKKSGKAGGEELNGLVARLKGGKIRKS